MQTVSVLFAFSHPLLIDTTLWRAFEFGMRGAKADRSLWEWQAWTARGRAKPVCSVSVSFRLFCGLTFSLPQIIVLIMLCSRAALGTDR